AVVKAADGNDGERRYRLLETFRQYGLEKLAEHRELEDARNRHRDFFVAFAEEAALHLVGPSQKITLARLEREHDNLRAALSWSLDGGETSSGDPSTNGSNPIPSSVDFAARLAGALWRFWWVYGHHAEGHRWLERALAVPPSDDTAEGWSARANACMGAAHLSQHLADFRSAIRHVETALTLWRRAGNERGIA